MGRKSDSGRRFRRLSLDEAHRALYIDFEGGKGKPPVLLGTLHRPGRGVEPYVHQVALDPEFAATGTIVRDFRNAIETLVLRAERKDSRIVAWTEHELDVVRTLHDADPTLVARFELRFANARLVARRWASILHPDTKPSDGTLATWLAYISYAVPMGAAPGHVGETIRTIRPRLERGLALTPLQAERWDRLLEHNRRDCHGMRAICLLAASELERQGTP